MAIYQNVNGTIRQVQNKYENVNGTIRKVYEGSNLYIYNDASSFSRTGSSEDGTSTDGPIVLSCVEKYSKAYIVSKKFKYLNIQYTLQSITGTYATTSCMSTPLFCDYPEYAYQRCSNLDSYGSRANGRIDEWGNKTVGRTYTYKKAISDEDWVISRIVFLSRNNCGSSSPGCGKHNTITISGLKIWYSYK